MTGTMKALVVLDHRVDRSMVETLVTFSRQFSRPATFPRSTEASAMAPEATCLPATEVGLNSCCAAMASPDVPFWIRVFATKTVSGLFSATT